MDAMKLAKLSSVLLVLAIAAPVLAQDYIIHGRRPAAVGEESQSLNFNDTDTYIQLTDHADLDTTANADFTYMFWLKTAGSNLGYLLSQGNFASTNTCSIAVEADNDAVFGCEDGGTVDCTDLTGSTMTDIGSWNLVALAYDESDTSISLYGCNTAGSCTQWATVGTCDFNSAFQPADNEYGRRADGNADRYYNGQLAYGSFHDGKAYTTGELSSLASGTKANYESEASDGSTVYFMDELLANDLKASCCGGSGVGITQNGSPTTNSDGPFD